MNSAILGHHLLRHANACRKGSQFDPTLIRTFDEDYRVVLTANARFLDIEHRCRRMYHALPIRLPKYSQHNVTFFDIALSGERELVGPEICA